MAVEVRHAEVRSVEAWFGGHCVAGVGPMRSVGIRRLRCGVVDFVMFRSGKARIGGQLTAIMGEKIWLDFQRKNVNELLMNT